MTTIDIDHIKSLASSALNDVIAMRRHLHSNPELSFHEHQTVQFVGEKLREFGIEEITPMAGTGLVALIRGKNADKKTIALRADMDALPITEANEVPYKSKNEGVMHAAAMMHTRHLCLVLQRS